MNSKTPQMTTSQSGKYFKVLHVTGSEGMQMPEHMTTKEAVIVVQKGTATLKLKGEQYPLKLNDTFVIPGGEAHTLTIRENFQAAVIMEIDSEIKFFNS